MSRSKLPLRSTMLRAVATRDADWDGIFYYGVSTTRVVCAPSCPSRQARPEHLTFFPSVATALDAGFRCCRRCHPEGAATPPTWLPRLLAIIHQDGNARLSDAKLTALTFDPVAVRRHFLRTHGVTFHAWLRTHRIAAAQRQLKEGAMLDQVIVNSRWESHSGFRDAFKQLVGAPPGAARDGEAIMARIIESPIGPLTIAAIDEGIIQLEFGDIERMQEQAPRLRRWFPGPLVMGSHPHLQQLVSELDEYFAGKRREFTVPLAIRGTTFETKVWQALQAIPYGVTCSYGDIAREVDSPKAVRAVGSANGRNRIAIVIPCHRVVNTGGALGGYGGGLWRKKRLLELEGGSS